LNPIQPALDLGQLKGFSVNSIPKAIMAVPQNDRNKLISSQKITLFYQTEKYLDLPLMFFH
jgi:hypothetical protein